MVSQQLISSDARVRDRVDDVRIDVVRLASLVTDAIAAGTQALLEGDLDEANRVVADDDAVDALRHEIEDECLRIFGLPGIAAPDLRFVGVAMRVAHELERSADLMVNVAKATWRLFPRSLHPTAGRLVDRLAARRRCSCGSPSTRSLIAIRRGPPRCRTWTRRPMSSRRVCSAMSSPPTGS